MDQLLERAPGTYNRFENGQMPHPGSAFLTAVAKALRLDEQEWTFLWRSARGENPPYALHRESGMAVPGVWRSAVEHISGAIAYISDAEWNVLAGNDEFRLLFPRGEAPANMMRWMLLDSEARSEVLVDWETHWAPFVMPQLRQAMTLRPGHPELARLEREVLDDPVAGPVYRAAATAPIPYPDGTERPVRHAVHGPGWVTTCVAEPVTSPGARVMLLSYTPDTPLIERHPVLSAPLRS